MSADNSEGTEDGKKRDLLGKKRDSKKAQKDQGYVKFDEDDSDTSHLNPEDIKSPSKAKKSKPFFKKQKQKEEKKEKEGKKEEKEKEKKKEEKDGKKKIKGKKKSKHEPAQVSLPEEVEKPIFGVPLSVAVERNPSHDGIELPRLFRECVDYIEEHGLTCEGIYRISGVKSKIQMLKDCYNRGAPVYLEEHEPNIIASLLKQFLRELPDPVLTKTLMPKFEEASVVRGEIARSEAFKKLIAELPTCNRLLLSWMIVHMTHVIEQAKENKMSLQNVSIVLSPTMQISHRVLNVLFQSASKLFSDVQLKRYKPPIKPTTSRWSLELPESLAQMEEELMKQESLLNALHKEMNEGVTNQDKEEQLWEVQRVVTQLKRKIKQATKEAADKRKKEECRPPTVAEDDELKLDLREVPIKQQAPPPPQDIKTEVKAETPPPSDDTANQVSVSQHAPPPSEQESVKVEAPPPDDDMSNQGIEKKEINQGSEYKEEIKNEGEQEAKDEMDSNEIKSIQETRNEENVEEETMKGQSETREGEVPDRPGIQQKEEDDRKGLNQALDTVEKEENNQEVPVDSDKKTLITKVLDQSNQVINSSEDEFENAVEKILEGEKGTAKEWTDESASEAGITDFEDRDETKVVEKHTSQEKVSHAEVEILKTEAAADSSSKDHTENETGEDSETDYEYVDDDEVMKLRDEEQALKLEEEELIAIESELRKKIETEKREIERLNQEIDELKYLRQDSDLEDYSSETDSSYESEDEDDLQEILGQLIKENENLEKKNAELCSKIHEERMICLDVKVQIRMLQQKQLESSLSIQAILG